MGGAGGGEGERSRREDSTKNFFFSFSFSSPKTAEEMSEGSVNAFSLARRAERRCPASLSQQQAATTTTRARAKIYTEGRKEGRRVPCARTRRVPEKEREGGKDRRGGGVPFRPSASGCVQVHHYRFEINTFLSALC